MTAEPRARLTRSLLLVILTVALVTAPVFLIAEGVEEAHVWRIVASNGVTALLCAGLLLLVKRGRTGLAGSILVFGLLALVMSLAWTNGEPVHVNVVNFVLVTLLASVLLGRRALVGVGLVAAAWLCAIAWKQAEPGAERDLTEARFESIVQFLPTFLVIVVILWLRERPAASSATSQTSA